MRIAIYARVSKALQQNPENQLIELREYSKKVGFEIEGEYVDEISSKDTRPQKEEILKKLRLGLLDGVVFWSLDRWGRTMSELVLEIEEFGGKKQVVSLKEGIDLTTAAGKLSAHIWAAMANFERDRIKERTLIGLARYKAQGGKLGRPKKIKTSLLVNNETGERSEIVIEKTPPANPANFSEEKDNIEKTDVFQG